MLSNATLNPTRICVIQQVRNCEINGFMLPKALVHDRDAIFGKYFDRLLREEFGVEPIETDFKRPWQNGKVGRFHLSLKEEVLFRVPISDVSHVRELCESYRRFHDTDRTHQLLEGRFPGSHNKSLPSSPRTSIQKNDRVGGLITVFREAA